MGHIMRDDGLIKKVKKRFKKVKRLVREKRRVRGGRVESVYEYGTIDTGLEERIDI